VTTTRRTDRASFDRIPTPYIQAQLDENSFINDAFAAAATPLRGGPYTIWELRPSRRSEGRPDRVADRGIG